MCDLVEDAEEPLRVGHVEARHADVLLEGEPEARLLIRLRVRHFAVVGGGRRVEIPLGSGKRVPAVDEAGEAGQVAAAAAGPEGGRRRGRKLPAAPLVLSSVVVVAFAHHVGEPVFLTCEKESHFLVNLNNLKTRLFLEKKIQRLNLIDFYHQISSKLCLQIRR